MEMWTTNNSSTNTLLSVNGNLSNLSSQNQLCTGFYNPVMAVFDILLVVFNLPTVLYMIVEPLVKQCRQSSNPGNSSPLSMSDIFFFHMCCVKFLHLIGVQLIIIRNLGGVTGIRPEYLTAFHNSSRIGISVIFAVMSIDLYMAVVHPVMYIGVRNSTKQTIVRTCCTFIWVCSITLAIVKVVFDISMYHPLIVTSFYIPLPVSVFCCILVLIALHTARPGKDRQDSKPDKTKLRALRFIKISMITLAFHSLPYSCLLIYTAVKKIEWESLPCHALPLLLLMQTADLAASLFCMYNTRKLKAAAKHLLTVFRNCIERLD